MPIGSDADLRLQHERNHEHVDRERFDERAPDDHGGLDLSGRLRLTRDGVQGRADRPTQSERRGGRGHAQRERHRERQDELTRLQEDYSRRIAAIEAEARTKIQESIKEGKRVALEIQEQARAQGAALITKSKETVELELAKAKITLRDQMVALTTDAVERILREKLDAEKDQRLVEAVLDELEREAPSA